MKELLKFLFGLIVVLAVLILIGRIFLFEVGQTASYSMVPNLIPGDLFIFRKVGRLGAGDIAVCKNPKDPSSLVVLRIVGLPGDEIEIKKNHLHINGTMLHYQYIDPIIYIDNSTEEAHEYIAKQAEMKVGGTLFVVALMDIPQGNNFRAVTVPNDSFFVLGDNRNMAHDSRNFGFVPIENCLGEAMFILWAGETSGDMKQSRRTLSWL